MFVIFFSESKQNNEKTPVQKTDESIELLFDNDAKNDDNVDSFMLYRTYTNNDYVLSLSNDEYVLMQPDNTNRFIGKFSYYNGNNVFDFVSKNELYNKYGLNSKKINMNNLFYVKAFYDTHIYNGIECYHKELNDNQELSFDFLVYFKETKEGKYLVATKLLNNPSIDFENAYF